jgi:hypothetical protein
MIIELLTQKGFVQNVDYSYENGELVALEQIRMVTQIDEDTQEEVQVEEAFYADLPSLAELKLEAVRQSDPALLISEYLKGKPVSDDDSLNVELFLNGQGGWRFAQVEAPSMDELFNLIQPVKQTMDIAQAKAERIAQGRADRAKCEMALDLVAGYNRQRSLSIEQITQMQSMFAQAEALLRANRPDFAAQVISAIEPDGVIITQEMKDDVLSVLQ